MAELSYFERGQMVSARLAGAAVAETVTLLRVSRARVPKAMSAYTNHGMATSVKKNRGRKSTLTERDRRNIEKDCFEKSQYCSAGELQQN
jgi:transposase